MAYLNKLELNPFVLIKVIVKLIFENKTVFISYGFLLTLVVFSYLGLTTLSSDFYSTLGYRFILGFLSFILVSIFLYRIYSIITGRKASVPEIVKNIKWLKYLLTICLQYTFLALISLPFLGIIYVLHDKLINNDLNYIPIIALLAAIFFIFPFIYYIYWMFTQIIVVVRHKYLDKALNYSKFLVKGNLLMVLYCLLIFSLFFIIPFLTFLGIRLLILLGVNKLVLLFSTYSRYFHLAGYLIITFFYSILILISVAFVVILFIALEKYKGIDNL